MLQSKSSTTFCPVFCGATPQIHRGKVSCIVDMEKPALDEIKTLSWKLLREGARGTNSPFRFPVLATRTENGVDARILVLRQAEEAGRTLEFHTDRRSAKINQLAQNNSMTWVFYDAQHKLQLRIGGSGGLCTDSSVVDARWNELRSHTKRAYAQQLTPGTLVDEIVDGAPCAHIEDPEQGRSNFAVVRCVVSEIEWLLLSRGGHQSAIVSYAGEGWSSSWVMP